MESTHRNPFAMPAENDGVLKLTALFSAPYLFEAERAYRKVDAMKVPHLFCPHFPFSPPPSSSPLFCQHFPSPLLQAFEASASCMYASISA